jgi:hypothetical protein
LLPLCSRRELVCEGHRKLLITSGPDHALVREAGLLIVIEAACQGTSATVLTTVVEFSGWTADRFSCAISKLTAVEIKLAHGQNGISREKGRWPSCAVINVMRAALADQWPAQTGSLFIAIPRRGLETELMELLLLEVLQEAADAGDKHARLLLDHLVEESGATDAAELIDAQRSRVEEMQQWQQEQLKPHADAVKRAAQRKLSKEESASAPAAASAATLPTSGSAAAAARLQIEERKPASSSPTLVSQMDSASMTNADNGHGNLAHAASSELTPAQSATAAELACSWTADAALTDVASLLQAGRRKYGVIVKAAVKFLHSLRPTSINQSGSHRVFNFGQTGPVTLVLPHSGRRSKDRTVSQRYCTQLYKAMQRATMRPFGLHAGAHIGQAQPQMQLKAASSSASVAELD